MRKKIFPLRQTVDEGFGWGSKSDDEFDNFLCFLLRWDMLLHVDRDRHKIRSFGSGLDETELEKENRETDVRFTVSFSASAPS